MSNKNIQINEELTCKPLDTYEELLLFLENPPSWRTLCREITPHSKLSIRNVDINKNIGSIEEPETFCHFNPDANEVERHYEKSLPKTLVCHDMANGYHDDSIIDGTGKYDAYTFYNWAGIDIFCYFSHHLITIPPLGWINVGHAHGVKVIGTVITEWSDGEQFWHKVLESEASYQHFASALIAVAKTLKFDGWLLNVENNIEKPDVLLAFVRSLHRALHRELPGAVLLWYDSVTVDGHLQWQNTLNEKNEAFFEACDGLFTNYSWSEGDVARGAERAARGGRRCDLFVGLDVWGRNFYGGGQFNTQAAVKVAHRHGCSLAVFAPAWTYEAMEEVAGPCGGGSGGGGGGGVTLADSLDRYHQFSLRDRALWDSLWPLLNTRLPSRLPFDSSFCRGLGLQRRMYGDVVSPGPWYNLRDMQYQPNSAHGPHGYLLTIGHVSRDSFQRSQKEEPNSKESKESGIASTADSVVALTEEENEDQDNDIEDGDRQNIKQKIKNELKLLYKLNAQKTGGAESEQGAEEGGRGPSFESGLSTVQSSDKKNLVKMVAENRYTLYCVPDELECLEVYLDDSFIGGSCLKIHPSDKLSPEHRLIRLFHCDFHIEDRLIACVVTKNLIGFEEQYLNVHLFLKNAEGSDMQVVLVGQSLPQMSEADQKESDETNVHRQGPTMYSMPLNAASDPVFRDVQKYLLMNQSGFYVPVENSYNWIVRYYQLPLEGCRITSVNLRTGLEQGPILIGHFGLCHRIDKFD